MVHPLVLVFSVLMMVDADGGRRSASACVFSCLFALLVVSKNGSRETFDTVIFL